MIRYVVPVMLVVAMLACGVLAKPKHDFHTIKAAFADRSGGRATGTVKIVCNAGQDADMVIVNAHGLKPGMKYRVAFVNNNDQKRSPVGYPGEAVTDEQGNFRYEVAGKLCPVDKWSRIVLVEEGISRMSADVGEP